MKQKEYDAIMEFLEDKKIFTYLTEIIRIGFDPRDSMKLIKELNEICKIRGLKAEFTKRLLNLAIRYKTGIYRNHFLLQEEYLSYAEDIKNLVKIGVIDTKNVRTILEAKYLGTKITNITIDEIIIYYIAYYKLKPIFNLQRKSKPSDLDNINKKELQQLYTRHTNDALAEIFGVTVMRLRKRFDQLKIGGKKKPLNLRYKTRQNFDYYLKCD